MNFNAARSDGGVVNRSSIRRLAPTVFCLALFVLLWLSIFHLPMKPRGGLDPSWVYVMAQVFENSMRAGVDYVFTQGPLSFLARGRGRYYPELFSAQMIYKIVWTSLVSLVFLLRARALEGLAIRAVYLILLMMIVSRFPNDPIHMFAITNCALLVILPTRHVCASATRYRLVLALVAITLALMSLGKFTNTLAVLAVLPPMLMAIGLRRSGRESLQFLGFFGAVFLAFWIGVAGQTLENLLPFLRYSLEITSGYSVAMGSGARPHEVRLALAGLASALAMLALSCPRLRWKAAPLYLGALVVCAILLLSWKSGFVRQAGQTSKFFVFLILAPFLVTAPQSAGRWRKWTYCGLFVLSLGFGVSGLSQAQPRLSATNFVGRWADHVLKNVKFFADPATTMARYDESWAELLTESELPEMRAKIGRGSVDVLTTEQSIPIFNSFAWKPRPVFQSYSAYSPTLANLNREHYEGASAPDFVIVKLRNVDRRFPLMADSLVHRIVRREYEPALTENGLLLLERRGENENSLDGEVLRSDIIRFGETIALDSLVGVDLTLSLSIDLSIRGRVESLLYRLPAVQIEIETMAGNRFTYRIVPGMTESGIVLNPLVTGQRDLVDWYRGILSRRVSTFRIRVSPPGSTACFEPEIAMTLRRFDSGQEISKHPGMR